MTNKLCKTLQIAICFFPVIYSFSTSGCCVWLVSRLRNGVQGFSMLFSSSVSNRIRSVEPPDRVFTRPWAPCHSKYPPLRVYRAICDGSLVFFNSRSMVSVQSYASVSLTAGFLPIFLKQKREEQWLCFWGLFCLYNNIVGPCLHRKLTSRSILFGTINLINRFTPYFNSILNAKAVHVSLK